ncbi:DUF58 domain-containing protein [Hydrogenimonas urashimensis]|uniref:DUF58 domain-containing protein n=1 Tax=Hydrogenimonas urashimensis TaxID=2740515 RepID=UPI00191692EC|nr:DUF58 domain-containing protein [Hydrogenimonas urashimensis]
MNKKAHEILIRTRRRLFGQNVGNNISTFQGNGIDFAELKEYTYGDDVRKINWKVTAREQKPYINVFNEERELNIVIVYMVSGSIYFGTVRQKQEVMAEMLALLGFAALKNSDRVTSIFYDEEVLEWFKPSKSPNIVYAALEYALNVDVLRRRTSLQKVADFLLRAIRERSIVLLLGDFYDIADLSLLGAKHEVYAVIVRDRFEENPAFAGEYDLIDPVSGQHHLLDLTPATLQRYREDLLRHDRALEGHFLKERIGFTKIYTDEDPFIKLREMLK